MPAPSQGVRPPSLSLYCNCIVYLLLYLSTGLRPGPGPGGSNRISRALGAHLDHLEPRPLQW